MHFPLQSDGSACNRNLFHMLRSAMFRSQAPDGRPIRLCAAAGRRHRERYRLSLLIQCLTFSLHVDLLYQSVPGFTWVFSACVSGVGYSNQPPGAGPHKDAVWEPVVPGAERRDLVSAGQQGLAVSVEGLGAHAAPRRPILRWNTHSLHMTHFTFWSTWLINTRLKNTKTKIKTECDFLWISNPPTNWQYSIIYLYIF